MTAGMKTGRFLLNPVETRTVFFLAKYTSNWKAPESNTGEHFSPLSSHQMVEPSRSKASYFVPGSPRRQIWSARWERQKPARSWESAEKPEVIHSGAGAVGFAERSPESRVPQPLGGDNRWGWAKFSCGIRRLPLQSRRFPFGWLYRCRDEDRGGNAFNYFRFLICITEKVNVVNVQVFWVIQQPNLNRLIAPQLL
jgi:hypothetical protein